LTLGLLAAPTRRKRALGPPSLSGAVRHPEGKLLLLLEEEEEEEEEEGRAAFWCLLLYR